MENGDNMLRNIDAILSGDLNKEILIYLDIQIKNAEELIELSKKQLERLGRAQEEVGNIIIKETIKSASTDLAIETMHLEENLENLKNTLKNYKK